MVSFVKHHPIILSRPYYDIHWTMFDFYIIDASCYQITEIKWKTVLSDTEGSKSCKIYINRFCDDNMALLPSPRTVPDSIWLMESSNLCNQDVIRLKRTIWSSLYDSVWDRVSPEGWIHFPTNCERGRIIDWFTGKSLSEALILVWTNPHSDDRLFMDNQFSSWKIQALNTLRT